MLLKPSYRSAADAYLEGVTKTEAARKAGFKQPKNAATRIFKREDVQLYLKQKQEKLAEAHSITKEDIAKKCWEVLELNPVDAMVRDEKGVLRIDLGAVKASANHLFKSGAVEITETTSGRKLTSVISIKGLAQLKSKALEILCRMHGFFDDSVELKGEINVIQALQSGRKRIGAEE